ncbi:MAG TPA: peptide chain release factor N(5)-glutamine methyltransferase [Gammaproteobacteria bacterium]|nr:peptide chain release factor N(5)-glutamine methyltransferase [Gammaproteobacteria bacterium]HRA42486.1 peptide chain release factor N(5)-glutamine methyltransferase [Gammaproteobacteria bacterium]
MISIHSILSIALKSSNLTSLEAEVLLAHVLSVSRVYLRAWHEKTVTEQQKQAFESLVSRRYAGEPLAYLVGAKEFWSLPLVISKSVLIPRPETECLVELVLNNTGCKDRASVPVQGIRALDLGTGSGAIALALAVERPHWKIIGVDRSLAALEIATLNAKNNQIDNVEFIKSDWFSCFEVDKTRFDIIVGNPPYIHPNDSHLEGDIRYEPKEALISFPDGLQDLKKIILEAPKYLVSKGWLFLEHGFDQGVFVKKSMELAGFTDVKTYKDVADLSRVTVGRRVEKKHKMI